MKVKWVSKGGDYILTITGKNDMECILKKNILVGHNASIFNKGVIVEK